MRIENISSKEVLQEYRQVLINRTKSGSDVIGAFKFLRGKGIRVALLTNERVERITGIDILNGREKHLITLKEGNNTILKKVLIKDFPVLVKF